MEFADIYFSIEEQNEIIDTFLNRIDVCICETKKNTHKLEIKDLPPELQNQIFYFLQHPVAEAIKRVVCHSCCKRKKSYKQCGQCDNLMCTDCEKYGVVYHKGRKGHVDVLCSICVDNKTEYYTNLHRKNKLKFCIHNSMN